MDVWVFDFFDVDADFFAVKCREFCLEFSECFTILTDDEGCTRSIDDNSESAVAVSDRRVTNWKSLEELSYEITDDDILLDSSCVFFFVVVSS